MRITVLQENLAKGLGVVGKAVESRPTMPVLSNVLLRSEDARLKLVAVNMTLGLGITYWIGARVDADGAITLPARTFVDLVTKLSPEHVEMQLDTATQQVQVHCGGSNSKIKGIDADEFPPVPEGGHADFMVPGRVLKSMIKQTTFAAATDDDRPILTGIYTELNGNVLTMAAADGYRLAVRTAEIEQHFGEPISMVIPAKSLDTLAGIIDDSDEVWVTLPGERNIIMFNTENVEVSAQLLNGRFPDFQKIIPTSYSTSTILDTSELLRACQRAEIFARDSAYSGRLQVVPPGSPSDIGQVRVIGKSAERGDQDGVVDATIEGEELDIAFNIKYLIEALGVINDDRVVLQSNGAANPGVLRRIESDDFIHVIMPMSVTK